MDFGERPHDLNFCDIICAGDFMKKNYDKWKIIMTLITMIFIVVMVILNVINFSEEKNSRAESVNQIQTVNE